MPNYAPTVHYKYCDISGVIDIWSTKCNQMAVYQHGPDDGQATDHCHILMLDCIYTTPEALKRIFHEHIKSDKKGNALWAWTHKKCPDPNLDYLRYCSKGTIAPCFLKNISQEQVEEQRSKWIVNSPEPYAINNEVKDKAKEDLYLIVELCDQRYAIEHESKMKVINTLTNQRGCNCGPERHFKMMCNIVTEILQEKRKRFNTFDFERYVYPIMLRRSEQCKEMFFEGLWNKFNRT